MLITIVTTCQTDIPKENNDETTVINILIHNMLITVNIIELINNYLL